MKPGPTTDAPRVSVVIAVYRDFRFFDEAVHSVLAQTFDDLELIIVDDGNDEGRVEGELRHADPRIRIVRSEANIGTAAAANLGIAAARGDIIVRLDADDVCEPARIAALVAALDADPDLGFVGSAVTLIRETGEVVGVQPMPRSDLEIRWTILFHNPFYHSTVAFRRGAYEAAGRYRVEELVSQDHYLWFEMLPHCRAANLAEPLVRYRLNPQGLTATNSKNNPRARTHPIRQAEWAKLGLTYDLHETEPAASISTFLRGRPPAKPLRAAAYTVILTLLDAFLRSERPMARASDSAQAAALARGILDRIAAAPPPEPEAEALRPLVRQVEVAWARPPDEQ